jgi:hypothetical protein
MKKTKEITMKKTWFNVSRIFALCFAVLATAQFAFADETQFTKSATSFFNETETFNKESKLLIDNTQEVDTTLLHFENALSVPHKVATALNKLNGTLATIKEMIVVAKQVPQTREQAQNLEKQLDAIKTPVANAAATATKLDKSVEPVRNATNKAETAVAAALDYETAFRTVAITYVDGIEKVILCSDKKTAIEPQTIKLLDGSTASFHPIDLGMHQVNQKYADTVAIPEKALKATIAEITEQIKQLEQILAAVNGLQDQLHPLNDALADLKNVLDKSLGFSFGYPCGPKMCSQRTPYPCGVKTYKKLGVKYPCGTEICHKEVPFTCGVNTCSAKVSMSLSTVINGSDAIEHKIESLLSSTAWKALKTIGVKKYVDDLKKEADKIAKPVLTKLHLNISTKLPDLNIKLTTAKLDTALPQLSLLDGSMIQIGKNINMKNPVFAPDIAKLQLLEKDFANLLKVSGCQAAPTKPSTEMAKRINWRNHKL